MMTINERANKEIAKARKALLNAFTILCDENAYSNESDIFHATTRRDADRIKAALDLTRD